MSIKQQMKIESPQSCIEAAKEIIEEKPEIYKDLCNITNSIDEEVILKPKTYLEVAKELIEDEIYEDLCNTINNVQCRIQFLINKQTILIMYIIYNRTHEKKLFNLTEEFVTLLCCTRIFTENNYKDEELTWQFYSDVILPELQTRLHNFPLWHTDVYRIMIEFYLVFNAFKIISEKA
jgi:hypothetical protein